MSVKVESEIKSWFYRNFGLLLVCLVWLYLENGMIIEPMMSFKNKNWVHRFDLFKVIEQLSEKPQKASSRYQASSDAPINLWKARISPKQSALF